MKIKRWIWIAGCSALLVGCGSGPSQEKAAEQESAATTDTTAAEAPRNLRTFVLPSTVQIAQLFRSAGLDYVQGVTNPVSRVSDYNTRAKRLLNYGVYSTDLTYCALNNQSQEAVNYLKAVQQLSEQIGFSEVFQEDRLLERFESNLGSPDSITVIMYEIQENTDFFIEDNNRKLEALVVFVGGWVEGMYLGVKATKDLDKQEISQRLVEQMAILDNLLSGLDYLKERVPALAGTYDRLQDMHTYYQGLDAVREAEGASGNVKISYPDLKTLADKITETREEITK